MPRRLAPLVAAVDVGSSSVRAGLYTAAGRPRLGAFAQVAYARDLDGRGSVSVPFDRLLAALADAVDGLVARAEADLGRVVGVGTSCFLHSVAGLDADRRPITPLLTWADTTAARAADDLRARVGSRALWQATGAPLHASYWPAKVVRLREATGDRVRQFAGAPELLWAALTGAWGMDLSLASGTGLLDRAAADWHPDLLRTLALQPAALPPIEPAGAGAPLAGWAAERWPSLAGRPWFAPWSDASCGNVGLGGLAGGPAALQVGTSGAIRVVLDDPVPDVPIGLFAHRLSDGTSLLGGQLSEGGGVAAAIAGLLGSKPAGLEEAALALAPDGHGLTVLPYLAGERGPGYHAGARGVVSGLTLATTPAELYLAHVEAIALSFAGLDRRLTTVTRRPAPVVASGGAVARSGLVPAVLAGALGRPIERSAEGEASTRGAALLALSAAGVIVSPAEVPPPPSVTVPADPVRVAAYAAASERREALYQAILGD